MPRTDRWRLRLIVKQTMKTYLSYGVGVNSTAMLILLANEGEEFESIYVDHGCDWPETRDYVKMISQKYPITILKPNVEGFDNLYEYCWYHRMVPLFSRRFCTSKFKVRVIQKYVETPCFQYIGFAADEAHRAKTTAFKGSENRFPLIERGIDRKGCVEIIKNAALSVPIKSGCYFCIFQRVGEWRKLRREHPDLFCKAQQLEQRNVEYRLSQGKQPYYLAGPKPLTDVVNEKQGWLFDEMGYAPCNCIL